MGTVLKRPRMIIALSYAERTPPSKMRLFHSKSDSRRINSAAAICLLLRRRADSID
jgi:hypothetical protein